VRRFSIRWRGGHRDPVVEAEAQHDLREAQVDALKTIVAQQGVALMTAGMSGWMWHGVARRQAVELARLRAQLKVQQLDQTRVLPRRDFDSPTEYVPRRYR
jgi:hypothetical protein